MTATEKQDALIRYTAKHRQEWPDLKKAEFAIAICDAVKEAGSKKNITERQKFSGECVGLGKASTYLRWERILLNGTEEEISALACGKVKGGRDNMIKVISERSKHPGAQDHRCRARREIVSRVEAEVFGKKDEAAHIIKLLKQEIKSKDIELSRERQKNAEAEERLNSCRAKAVVSAAKKLYEELPVARVQRVTLTEEQICIMREVIAIAGEFLNDQCVGDGYYDGTDRIVEVQE